MHLDRLLRGAERRSDLLVETAGGNPTEDLVLTARQPRRSCAKVVDRGRPTTLTTRDVRRTIERREQGGLVARLLEKVERPGANGAHRRGDVAVPREEHGRD